jgi:hypothetical protein
MIGIVICPAIAVSCRHAEQVPHSHRLAARRRGVGQLRQMGQYRIVQTKRTVALEHANRQ